MVGKEGGTSAGNDVNQARRLLQLGEARGAKCAERSIAQVVFGRQPIYRYLYR